MIPFSDFKQIGEQLEPGQFTRVSEHTGCGGSSKALRIRRLEDGTIMANCYRCGNYGRIVPSIQAVRQAIQDKRSPKPPSSIPAKRLRLPRDSVQQLGQWPRQAAEWVTQYGLSQRDVNQMGAVYSAWARRVIFPFYKRGELVGYQTRRIYADDTYPKYVKFGRCESRLFRCDTQSDTIVLVEDILSGKVVSKVSDSCVVLGTSMVEISMLMCYKKFIIFFDNDNSIVKHKQSMLKRRLELFGDVMIVKHDKDPKELTTLELEQCLNLK